MIKNTVFLSIGSNLKPEKNIKTCLNYLKASFALFEESPIYQSPSYGFEGNDFLNLVVRINTSFDLISLKHWLMSLEDIHSRDRSKPRYSNRTLDIDILLYNDEINDSGSIKIPRPEILTQAYVLKPLADIAPAKTHAISGKSFLEHWNHMKQSSKIELKFLNHI